MDAANETPMNGAECLVRTLVAGGVNVCFANPGTSEMHFVAALDRVEGMRCVLTLFEGVATGAADGYARMAEKPAATLLHLGPGLANGLANLHNAMKAATPVVNIVGDHATWHRRYDAPLTSDIETAARPFSVWVRTSPNAQSVAEDGAAAIVAACTPPGGVATLILPGDTAWDQGSGVAQVPPVPARHRVEASAVAEAAEALRSGEPTLILVGGLAVRQRGLELASKIARKTGARLIAETFNSRMERGAGRVAVEPLPYPVDQAVEKLRPFKRIVLVGAKPPVAFFAYPGKPSLLAQPDTQFHVLARAEEDIVHALEWLADELGANDVEAAISPLNLPQPATGAISPAAISQSLAALMPENAIVVDEGVTASRNFFGPTNTAQPHDWLRNRGGSIGIGPPLAIGAAIPARTARSSRCRRTAPSCTRCRRSGRRLVRIWTSPPSSSPTALTPSCATSLRTLVPGMSAARRWICWTSAGRTSTGFRWPGEWACQVSGLRRWTSSTARWSGASPNPGRSSSRR